MPFCLRRRCLFYALAVAAVVILRVAQFCKRSLFEFIHYSFRRHRSSCCRAVCADLSSLSAITLLCFYHGLIAVSTNVCNFPLASTRLQSALSSSVRVVLRGNHAHGGDAQGCPAG